MREILYPRLLRLTYQIKKILLSDNSEKILYSPPQKPIIILWLSKGIIN